MQALFQSTFLQALGFAITSSLWQTALVWLIFMLANNLVTLTASAKYRLAVAAQFISFTWFIITFQFYYHQYSDAWQQSAMAGSLSENMQTIPLSNGSISSQILNWMVTGEQLLPYVSMAYLLLLLFLCIRWFMGYRQTQLIRNNGLQNIPFHWCLFVKKIAAQLGIKKEIQLFLSDLVTTPMTIGFLKPIILIPVASINHLSTDQLEAVILHELAHIKRYDYLINIILSVVEISLFFNPFIQLLGRSIRKERENSCDDWVLQFQYQVSVYAEALLRIAWLQAAPAFAMTASGKKNELLIRVKRMIDKKENRFNYRKQLLAFVIVTGILCSIAWLNPIASTHKNMVTSASNKSVFVKNAQPFAVEPMAVSIKNPLFNPVFFLSAPLKKEMQKNIAAAQKEIAALDTQNSKENKVLIESIPPMIANALEQASVEILEKKSDWGKQLVAMDMAKMNLEKAFKIDSASIPNMFRAPLKDEFTRSLKSIGKEIARAKMEMFRNRKITSDIQIDGQKIQRDIKLAMEEINKLGLEKLIFNALEIPGVLFENDPHKKSVKNIPPHIKESEYLRLQKDIPEKETQPITDNSIPEDTPVYTEDVAPGIPSFVLAQIASMANLEKYHTRQATINKIKTILKEWESLNLQNKKIPVVFKEKKMEDNKIIIQMR